METKNIVKWSIIALLGLILLTCSMYSIKSTERGVLSTFGKISETVIDPGFHMKWPFIQGVKKVNVQQKKFDGKENSYTRDVQTTEVDYTVNYDLVESNASNLIKNVGDSYHERIVVPYIRTAIKEAFGNHAATEIVENRDIVRIEIEEKLRATVDSNYFKNIRLQLIDIDFDDAFENSIKEKQVAEQQALKAKNVTVQVEEQAKQTKIRAEAEAEAIRIKANALERNPKIVDYEAISKWDGHLPQYMMGNSIPLINIGK